MFFLIQIPKKEYNFPIPFKQSKPIWHEVNTNVLFGDTNLTTLLLFL